VRIEIDASPSNQVEVEESIVFGVDDWDVPREVTVTAIDDDIDEQTSCSEHCLVCKTSAASTVALRHRIAGADSRWLEDTVTVTIADNDEAGVVLSHVEGGKGDFAVTRRAGESLYEVRLASQPSDSVTVDMVETRGALTVTPGSVSFGPLDWNTPQTVRVSVRDDAPLDVKKAELRHYVESDDAKYDGRDARFTAGGLAAANGKLAVIIAESKAEDDSWIVFAALAAGGLLFVSMGVVALTQKQKKELQIEAQEAKCEANEFKELLLQLCVGALANHCGCFQLTLPQRLQARAKRAARAANHRAREAGVC